MDTHNLVAGLRVQRFPLTIVWSSQIIVLVHTSISSKLGGITGDIRTQFSKIDNIREQLFHAWGSFCFDENA